jgi:hypothetical protein
VAVDVAWNASCNSLSTQLTREAQSGAFDALPKQTKVMYIRCRINSKMEEEVPGHSRRLSGGISLVIVYIAT